MRIDVLGSLGIFSGAYSAGLMSSKKSMNYANTGQFTKEPNNNILSLEDVVVRV